MKLKSNQPRASAEQVVKDIRRATRRHYSTEDKIRIVLSGLRGEDSIAELCRKEWHSPNSVDKYYCQNLNGRNANAKS